MTPAPSQGPSLCSEGPSSAFCRGFSALGGRTAAWRLNILCFAVLTTRERENEITQRPQRDSCFLCVKGRQRIHLRDCSDACICEFACIFCVCVCVCLWGQKEWSSRDAIVLAGPHSFFHSLPSFSVVLCCLVVFVMKIKLYLSVTYHVCIWGAKYLNTHYVLAIGNFVYGVHLL